MYQLVGITGGKNVPASIYRVRCLVKFLANEGINLDEICPMIPKYPPKATILRPLWLITAIMERLTFLWKAKGYDAVILQRELISTLPTVEKFLPGKKILDVDDAIYLYKKGLAAQNAAKASIGVVCGNDILAENFSKWNSRIEIIPTGVDVANMEVNPFRLKNNDRRIIGWIGTPGNLQFVENIANSLIKVLKKKPNCELRIVTSTFDAVPQILRPYTKFVKWYPGIEFDQLPHWSLGIMPLADNEWTRGKCSFKLLQYLSAGIPAVVSPVGMNIEVMSKSSVGYMAKTTDDWIDALISLISDTTLNYKMGLSGRKVVENYYSLQVIAKKWRSVLDRWL